MSTHLKHPSEPHDVTVACRRRGPIFKGHYNIPQPSANHILLNIFTSRCKELFFIFLGYLKIRNYEKKKKPNSRQQDSY